MSEKAQGLVGNVAFLFDNADEKNIQGTFEDGEYIKQHIQKNKSIEPIFKLIENEDFVGLSNDKQVLSFNNNMVSKQDLIDGIVQYLTLRFKNINNYLENKDTTVIKDDNELIKLLNLYPGDIAIVEEMFKFKNELINNEEYGKLIEEYKKFSTLIFEKKLTDGQLKEEGDVFRQKMEEEEENNLAWNLGLVLASDNNDIDNNIQFGPKCEEAIGIIKKNVKGYEGYEDFGKQAQRILKKIEEKKKKKKKEAEEKLKNYCSKEGEGVLDIFLKEESFKEFKEVVETLLPDSENNDANKENNEDNVNNVNSVIGRLHVAITNELAKDDLATEQLDGIQTIVINVNNYCYDKKEVFKNRIEANTGKKNAWSENLEMVKEDFETKFNEKIEEKKQQQIKNAKEFLKGIKAEEGRFTEENFDELEKNTKILLPDTKENGADEGKNKDNVDIVVNAVNKMYEAIKIECNGKKDKNSWEETGKLINDFKKYIESDDLKKRINNNTTEENKYKNDIEDKIKDLEALQTITKLKAEFNNKELTKELNIKELCEVKGDVITIKDELTKDKLEEYRSKIERIKKHNETVQQFKENNRDLSGIVGDITFQDIDNLDGVIEAINKKLEELEQEHNDEHNEGEDLEEEKQKIEEDIKKFNDELAKEKINKLTTTEKVKEQIAEIEKLEKKAAEFDEKNKESISNNQITKICDAAKNQQYKILQDNNKQLQVKLKELEQKELKEKAKKEKEEIENEIKEFNTKNKIDEINNKNEIKQIEEIEKKLEEVKTQVEDFNKKFGEGEEYKNIKNDVEEIKDNEGEYKTLIEYKEALNERKANLEKAEKEKEEKKKKEEAKKALEEAEEELKQKIKEQKTKLDKIDIKIADGETDEGKVNETIKQAEETIKQVEDAIKQAETTYKDAHKAAKEAKVEGIGDKPKALDAFDGYNGDQSYKQKLEDANKEVEKAQEELKEIKKKNLKAKVKEAEEKLKETIATKIEELKNIEVKVDKEEADKKVQLYNNKIQEANNKKNEAGEEIKRLHEEYTKVHKEATKAGVDNKDIDENPKELKNIGKYTEYENETKKLNKKIQQATTEKNNILKDKVKKAEEALKEQIEKQVAEMEKLSKKTVVAVDVEVKEGSDEIQLQNAKKGKEEIEEVIRGKYNAYKEAFNEAIKEKVDGYEGQEVENLDVILDKDENKKYKDALNTVNGNIEKAKQDSLKKQAKKQMEEFDKILEEQSKKLEELYKKEVVANDTKVEANKITLENIKEEENKAVKAVDDKFDELKRTLEQIKGLKVNGEEVTKIEFRHLKIGIESIGKIEDKENYNMKKELVENKIKTEKVKQEKAKLEKQLTEAVKEDNNDSLIKQLNKEIRIEENGELETNEKQIQEAENKLKEAEKLIEKINKHNEDYKKYEGSQIETDKESCNYKKLTQAVETAKNKVLKAKKQACVFAIENQKESMKLDFNSEDAKGESNEEKTKQNIKKAKEILKKSNNLIEEIERYNNTTNNKEYKVTEVEEFRQQLVDLEMSVRKAQEALEHKEGQNREQEGEDQAPPPSQQEIDGSGSQTPPPSQQEIDGSGSQTPPPSQQEIDGSGSQTPPPSQQEIDGSGAGSTPSASTVGGEASGSVAPSQEEIGGSGSSTPSKPEHDGSTSGSTASTPEKKDGEGQGAPDEKITQDNVGKIVEELINRVIDYKDNDVKEENLNKELYNFLDKYGLLDDSTGKIKEDRKEECKLINDEFKKRKEAADKNGTATGLLDNKFEPDWETIRSPKGKFGQIMLNFNKLSEGTITIKKGEDEKVVVDTVQKPLSSNTEPPKPERQKTPSSQLKKTQQNPSKPKTTQQPTGNNNKYGDELLDLLDMGLDNINKENNLAQFKFTQSGMNGIFGIRCNKNFVDVLKEIQSQNKEIPSELASKFIDVLDKKTIMVSSKQKSLKDFLEGTVSGIYTYVENCANKQPLQQNTTPTDSGVKNDDIVDNNVNNGDEASDDTEKENEQTNDEGQQSQQSQQTQQSQQQSQQTQQSTSSKDNSTTRPSQKKEAMNKIGDKLNNKTLALMLAMQSMNRMGPGMNPMTMMLPMLLGGNNKDGKIDPKMMALLMMPMMAGNNRGAIGMMPIMMLALSNMMDKKKEQTQATDNSKLKEKEQNISKAADEMEGQQQKQGMTISSAS